MAPAGGEPGTVRFKGGGPMGLVGGYWPWGCGRIRDGLGISLLNEAGVRPERRKVAAARSFANWEEGL